MSLYLKRCLVMLALSFMLSSMVHAETFLRTFTASDGTSFDYALALPDDFDETKSYPTVLALPPGDQSLSMVEAGFGYWSGGEKRGWVIISPVAPNNKLFFQGSEVYLPDLLDELSQSIKFEGGKVHLAGISNGGRSAFRLALDYPERFHSLLGVPAFPPQPADFDNLERLKNMTISLYAGEFDSLWANNMLKTQTALEALNIPVTATVVPNEGHVIQSLNPTIIFDLLDGFR